MTILTKIKQKLSTLIPMTIIKQKDHLTIEEIKKALMEVERMEEERNKGDGKAVFLSDMNEEEYQEYVHNEIEGWKGFTNKVVKLFNLNK